MPKKRAALLFLSLLLALSPLAALANLPISFKPSPKKAPFEKVERLGNSPFGADDKLLTIDFIDIGLGDAILFTCGGKTLLLDGGTRDRAGNTVGFLKKRGIDHLDYLVNSHPHDDHIQGQLLVVQKGIEVDRFISGFPQDFAYKEQIPMVKELKAKSIPYHTAQNEETLDLGGATVTFFMDTRTNKKLSINDRSMLMHVKFGNATALFTADVTGDSQGYLLKEYPQYMDVDVLKAPHHGYNFLMPGYFEETTPAVCVVTNSRATAVRADKQLTRKGVPRYFLSMGGVHLQTDGKQWYAWQEKFKR